MFEGLGTNLDAFAGGDIKFPMMLGAGQFVTLQGQVRDVGYLMRAAAVIHAKIRTLAIDE